jgi:hypothetical protein
MQQGRWPAALALALTAGAALPSPTSAYRFHAVKWPAGIVRYYNAASDQSWAVTQAINAWNQSGAHIRFEAVPRAQAELVIHDPANKVYCSEGYASVGFVRSAHVVIFPAHGITHSCNRYWAARMMAHELGHVLGLVHEDRYCAAMNATGSMRGGSECEPKLPWMWRCRLLEPDDVAGVADVYGGRPRAVLANPLCPLYEAIAKPAHLGATYDAATGIVTLSFQRPEEAVIPSFVFPSPWKPRQAFAIAGPMTRCSAKEDGSVLPRWLWHVVPNHTETFTTRAVPGTHCYAVWAIDKLGRSSDNPAVVSISVA